MTQVRIRALRPFYLCGQVVEPGSIVDASATDAAASVGTGRAEFLSSDDAQTAKAGVIAADAKACPHVRAQRGSFWNRD